MRACLASASGHGAASGKTRADDSAVATTANRQATASTAIAEARYGGQRRTERVCRQRAGRALGAARAAATAEFHSARHG